MVGRVLYRSLRDPCHNVPTRTDGQRLFEQSMHCVNALPSAEPSWRAGQRTGPLEPTRPFGPSVLRPVGSENDEEIVRPMFVRWRVTAGTSFADRSPSLPAEAADDATDRVLLIHRSALPPIKSRC